MPYLGNGMELMHLSFLGDLARGEGYATWWLQGSSRTSQRMNLVAERAGFEEFAGAEDMADPMRSDGRLKAWDHVLLEEAGRRFLETKEPFLGFVHTACTHPPLRYPRPEWLHHPSDSMENDYRNTLRYADDALGRFFDTARSDPRFSRTIFFLTADHTLKLGAAEGLDLFHIPCLVIAPGLAPRIDDRIGSQVDAVPTIVHLAGWGTPYAALGRSLFDDVGLDVRGALCRSSHLLYRVERGGYVADTFESRADAKALEEGADLDAVQRRLRAMAQTAANLLLHDRLR
jgi:phosphoglycerol transferase MdoB-like AlkP superfamily enzyme